MREKIWLKQGLWLIGFLFLWLAFSLAAANFLDPDFGWHFKTGEWIWTHRRVPRTDLFSYTMPEYPLKYPGWLAELIIYKLYPLIGYSGLAFFFGLIGALAFRLVLPKKAIGFVFGPWLLAGLAALSHMSVRPKIVSYWLAAGVFVVIRKSFQKPQWLLILPFLFLAWANLHGSFLIGLEILALVILTDVYHLVREKENRWRHFQLAFLSLFLSVAATLANPYGWRIYQEVFATAFSNELHFKIAEWLPYSTLNLGVVFYVGGSLALFYLFRDRLSLFEKITSGFLLIVGFWSGRLLIYYLLFTLPLFVCLVENFYRQVKLRRRFLKIWHWRWRWLTVFLILVGLAYSWQINLCQLDQGKFYPTQAVGFLQKKEMAGNLFSIYNWGGYLIWQLPEKKVFIDGRMAIWQQDGYSAFRQMEEILTGEVDYRPIFEKYSISAALLPAPRENKRVFLWLTKLFSQRETLSLSQRLSQDGWQLIYKDETAQVLVRRE